MILGLDHVAIAVDDLDGALRRFVEDIGLKLERVEDVPAAQTRTAFLPMNGRPTLELVTPLDGQGPLVRSLSRRGPGLHHLAFRCDNLAADMRRLRDRGYRFTTDEPTAGAHGTRVAFLHPSTMGGVLVELVEAP